MECTPTPRERNLDTEVLACWWNMHFNFQCRRTNRRSNQQESGNKESGVPSPPCFYQESEPSIESVLVKTFILCRKTASATLKSMTRSLNNFSGCAAGNESNESAFSLLEM
jgi:hypothetical protein